MTKTAAKSKAGFMVYFPGAPLRKVAHRSVSSSKTLLSLRGRRLVAAKSSPPRKLTLKKKPITPTWFSTYPVSLSDSDSSESYHCMGSSPSCCSSVASNAPSLFLETTSTASWSSNYSVSLSVSDEDYCNNQSSDSDDSSESYSSTGLSLSSSFQSSGSSNHPPPMPEQPTLYVLCKLVNGVLVRV